MSEWRSYTLEDFLLFSPRTYWRLFETQNAALWPLQLLSLAAGLAIVAVILCRPERAKLWVWPVLGLAWVFVGWSFLLERYGAINWAIAYAVPAFFLQALLLLLGAGILRGGPAFGRLDAMGAAGLALALGGMVLYPALPLVSGRPLASGEVFGIAPDPTVIVTLGLLQAARGRWCAVLLPIPLLWCLFSGLTLRAMGEAQAWLLLASAALVLVLATVRLWRSRWSAG